MENVYGSYFCNHTPTTSKINKIKSMRLILFIYFITCELVTNSSITKILNFAGKNQFTVIVILGLTAIVSCIN